MDFKRPIYVCIQVFLIGCCVYSAFIVKRLPSTIMKLAFPSKLYPGKFLALQVFDVTRYEPSCSIQIGRFSGWSLSFGGFYVKFYLIFTFLKLCGRILTKGCYDAEMKESLSDWLQKKDPPPPYAFSLLLIFLLEFG